MEKLIKKIWNYPIEDTFETLTIGSIIQTISIVLLIIAIGGFLSIPLGPNWAIAIILIIIFAYFFYRIL